MDLQEDATIENPGLQEAGCWGAPNPHCPLSAASCQPDRGSTSAYITRLDACSQDAGLTDARDMPKLCLLTTLKERHEEEQSLDIESAHRLTLREINDVHGLPH